MAIFGEFPGATAMGEQAAKAWRAPLGAVSPLWVAFGAAASAGVAFWWATHWTRAVNVEAMASLLGAPASPPAAPVETLPEPAPILAAEPEPVPAAEEAFAEMALAAAPAPELVFELEPEPEPVVLTADDLTRMSGIGPKLSEALAGHGVTRFAQIAAWTAEDLGEIDRALRLKGRAVREAWVAQAKRLASAAG